MFVPHQCCWLWNKGRGATLGLALHDTTAPTKVSTDALPHGLGTVPLQQIDSSWRHASFCTFLHLGGGAQICKDQERGLGYNKLANLLIGKHFLSRTDHKPLVPLLGVKHLDTFFQDRLDRFWHTISN
jgi:hypothetical protein